jgi:hypothetical protein
MLAGWKTLNTRNNSTIGVLEGEEEAEDLNLI